VASRSASIRIRNEEVDDVLERIADLLETQDGQRYRVRAYRGAAGTLRGSTRPVQEIDEAEGREGLERLPGVGRSIASLIHEFVHTGRSGLLERLEGQVSPEDLFTTVPGIGEDLASRIHTELGVETLEDLELAAHDGRLERVSGFGARRVRAVRDALAATLGRSARRRARRIRAAEAAGAGRVASAPPRPPESARRSGRPRRPCSTWMRSTGGGPLRGSCAPSLRVASTRKVVPGSRSSTPSGRGGPSTRSSPTRLAPTSSA
jgi:hypothetical protein